MFVKHLHTLIEEQSNSIKNKAAKKTGDWRQKDEELFRQLSSSNDYLVQSAHLVYSEGFIPRIPGSFEKR